MTTQISVKDRNVSVLFSDLKSVITSQGPLVLARRLRDLPYPRPSEQQAKTSLHIPKGSNPSLVAEGFRIKAGESTVRVFGWGRRPDGAVNIFTSAPIIEVETTDGRKIRNVRRLEGASTRVFTKVTGTVEPV